MSDAHATLAALNSNPELQRLMALPAPGCPRGAALAASGVPYRLNGRPVPPPAADHVLALSMVGSPLLTGAGEIGAMDAWRALYAVTRGTAGLEPLAGLDGSLREIERIETSAGRDPAVAIDRRATAAWAEIDHAALALAQDYGNARPQEVADLILTMLADVADAWACVPRGDEKKTAPGRMATGLAASWRWARGLGLRLARFCAVRRWPWLAWLWPARWASSLSTRRNAPTAPERTGYAASPTALHGR